MLAIRLGLLRAKLKSQSDMNQCENHLSESSSSSSEESRSKRKSRRTSRHKKKKTKRKQRYSSSSQSESDESLTNILLEDELRRESEVQQKMIFGVLNDFASQLDEETETRKQREFEDRIEKRLEIQNENLLLKVLHRIPSSISNPFISSSTSNPFIPSSISNPFISTSIPNPLITKTEDLSDTNEVRQTNVINKIEHPVLAEVEGPPEKPTSAVSSTKQGAKEEKLTLSKPDIKTQDDSNIWDTLMDEDNDLLYMSEDETEKKEKEKRAGEKKLEAERILKQKKLTLLEDIKPLYRWKNEGVTNPPASKVLRGVMLFRAIASTVIFAKRLHLQQIRYKIAQAPEDLKDIELALGWFTEKTQGWCGHVLTNIFNDILSKENLVLDPASLGLFGGNKFKFKKTRPDDSGSNAALLALRLRIRVRGILEQLLRSVSKNKPAVTPSIFTFLRRIIFDGCVFPSNYLFEHEVENLEFGQSMHTRWMIQLSQESDQPVVDLSRQKLVLANFVFVRCLIPLLLDPGKSGLTGKTRPKRKIQNNLTVLSSILFALVQITFGGPSIETIVSQKSSTSRAKVRPVDAKEAEHEANTTVKKSNGFKFFKKLNKVSVESLTNQHETVLTETINTKTEIVDDIKGDWFVCIDDLANNLFSTKHFQNISPYLGFLDELKPLLQLLVTSILHRIWLEENSQNNGKLSQQVLETLEKEILQLTATLQASDSRKTLAHYEPHHIKEIEILPVPVEAMENEINSSPENEPIQEDEKRSQGSSVVSRRSKHSQKSLLINPSPTKPVETIDDINSVMSSTTPRKVFMVSSNEKAEDIDIKSITSSSNRSRKVSTLSSSDKRNN